MLSCSVAAEIHECIGTRIRIPSQSSISNARNSGVRDKLVA